MNEPYDVGPTVATLAKRLDRSTAHVRRLIRQGRLQATKVGKSYYIEPESARRFLGAGDDGQKRLALQWLALVDNRGHGARVATLMRRTFNLGADDLRVVLRKWGARKPDTIVNALLAEEAGHAPPVA